MSEKTSNRDISVRVPILARVEGEGALELDVKDGQITNLKMRIYEPPRMFEKFLEGRTCDEVLDIVARICGICPVAYQMSAAHAMESIFGVTPSAWVRAMRRVFYCGEWIESHSLHIHMLAAPDFLGYGNIIEMARDYPEEARRGLMLQALGKDLVQMFGARSVHPVGVRIGGFHRAPDVAKVQAMCQRLREALPQAEALVAWTASLSVPDDPQSFPSVALRHEEEYPFNEGRLVSDQGLDISIEEYQQHFTEHHIAHSTALHSLLHGKPYLVGPLARVNLNHDLFPPQVRKVMESTGIHFPSKNGFHSAVARAVEIYYSVFEALRILEAYEVPESPFVEVKPKAGVGYGCTEAPRGILWHRYEVDDQGIVKSAHIMAPTSQNQARIEEDLRTSLERLGFDRSDDEIRLHAEMVIRNYDPCISCATHFLKVAVNRQ